MQSLFARRRPGPDSFDLRPATPADRAALTRLTERARRTHFHLDWLSLDDWIAESANSAWIASAGKHIAGALIAPAQDMPVAWVRLIAIADDYHAGAVLGAFLPAAIDSLHASGVGSLACLAYPDWLAEQLPELGFVPFTDVTHFRKDDRSIPEYGSHAVTIRAAKPGDLPIVLANDRAAFDPIWWHSRDSLARIYRDAAHFIVAELDGRVVGHAFSDRYGGGGHLIRLAVHPDHRERGIGTRLLAEALTYLLAAGAYPITLNTQADNYASQSLYRRFGFMPTGESTTVMIRMVNEA
jgi:ribosomal-protein-alanine N-acetyltransferase